MSITIKGAKHYMELTILQDNLVDLNFYRPTPESLVDLEPLLVAEFENYYSELPIEVQFETYMKEVIKVVSYYTGYQLKPMLRSSREAHEVNLNAPLYTYMGNYFLFDYLFMWRNEITAYKSKLAPDEPINRTIEFSVTIDPVNFEALFDIHYATQTDSPLPL